MNEFVELIREGAEALGLQTARLWPQVVAVYWLKNLVNVLVLPISAAALLVIAWKLARAVISKFDDNSDDALDFLCIGIAVVTGVFGLVLIISIIDGLDTTIAALLYPEASLVLDKISK